MNGGTFNLGYGSGASSIKDENSSVNLLSLENSTTPNDERAEIILVNGKRINPMRNKSINHNHVYANNNGNNNIRPLDKLDLNNTSQSSMDTRIKYGNEADLIPLMPVDSSNSLCSNAINSNVQIPMCQIVESEEDFEREPWYTIFLQVLFPFLIAGFGMVAAGVVLDEVQVNYYGFIYEMFFVFSNLNLFLLLYSTMNYTQISAQSILSYQLFWA